jgi:hypothetical protein
LFFDLELAIQILLFLQETLARSEHLNSDYSHKKIGFQQKANENSTEQEKIGFKT